MNMVTIIERVTRVEGDNKAKMVKIIERYKRVKIIENVTKLLRE